MWTRLICASALIFGVACDDNTPTDAGTDSGGGGDAGQDAGPAEPTCDEYCDAVLAACTGANAQYQEASQCLGNCALISWELGTPGDTDGNTVACRTTHAGLAAADPATHCAHAGTSGGDVCGTWCENYCAYMDTNCGSVYADNAECMTACAALPDTGAANDMTGDTVQCRTTMAAFAVVQPALCAAAPAICRGPYTCAEYCATVTTTCADANQQYASSADCMTYCSMQSGWAEGVAAPTDLAIDTLACRTLHAQLASATGEPATHCPHAGPSGADTCGSWCDVYCDLTMNNCTGADELFATAEECATACGAYADTGAPGDENGDTVQCRIYHAGLAGLDATTHCPHAAAVSTVCN